MGKAYAVIVALLLGQSSWLVAFSTKEGVGEVTLIAAAVALAPVAVVTVIFAVVRRRRGGMTILLSVGASMLAVMEILLPVSPFKTTLVTALQARALDAVDVGAVDDAPFLSPRGNPVGVRVTFEARFPRGGELSVSPTLYPEEESHRHFRTAMSHFASFTVEPAPSRTRSGEQRFEAGVTYQVTADFLPDFLFLADRAQRGLEAGEICLREGGGGALPGSALKDLLADAPGTGYLLEIQGRANTYFTAPRVLYSGSTKTVYSMKSFRESALKEGAPPCPW